MSPFDKSDEWQGEIRQDEGSDNWAEVDTSGVAIKALALAQADGGARKPTAVREGRNLSSSSTRVKLGGRADGALRRCAAARVRSAGESVEQI